MNEFWSALSQNTYNESGFFPIESTLKDLSQAFIAPAIGYALLRIRGEKAAEFLQGQCTANIEKITTDQATPTCFCNLKGRMESNGYLWRDGDDFLYLCQRELAHKQKEILTKYAMFSGCELSVLEEPLFFTNNNSATPIPENNQRIALPLHEYELSVVYAPSEQIEKASPQWSAEFVDQRTIDFLLITQGVLLMSLEQSESFLPQALNWDLIGGVSFNKGCYRGQEVVARMHFKGKMKNRLYQLEINNTDINIPFDIWSDDKKAGKALLQSQQRLLAELRHEFASLALHDEKKSVQLKPLPLPYAIPEEELANE